MTLREQALAGRIVAPRWFDARWAGRHGIGRFASEVQQRLPLVAGQLTHGRPMAPGDVVNIDRMRIPRNSTLYSPGWNCGLARCVQVITLHDLMHLQTETSRMKRLYYETVVRSAILEAGTVLTVSGESRRRIETWLDGCDVAVVDVGNGVSSSFVRSESPRIGRPTMLYVGNLKKHKRFDIVCDALALLPDFVLRVVTSHRSQAIEILHSRGLAERAVVMAGLADPELAREYRAASVVVMPSMDEGFGLPAVEAVACGTPVVFWSGCQAIAEAVSGAGAVVDELEDRVAWATAITEMVGGVADPAEGYEEWRQRHSWDTVAARIDAALTSVENCRAQ